MDEEDNWFAQSFAEKRAAASARDRMTKYPGLRCLVVQLPGRKDYVLVALGPNSALDPAYASEEWGYSSHVVLDADTLRDLHAMA